MNKKVSQSAQNEQPSTELGLKESLSALVDGEASELEIRRLLKANDADYSDIREQWLRYQTVSASLKNDTPAVDYMNLSAAISDAIADEPSLSVSNATVGKVSSIWSGVGRFAVAASVAGAVVLGVQFMPSTGSTQIVELAPTAAPSAPASSFAQGLPNNTAINTVSNESGVPLQKQEKPTIEINESTKQQLKEAEQEVNRLMLEHAQNSAQNTQQGVLPYARVPESK